VSQTTYRRADIDLRQAGLRDFRLGMFELERDPAAAERHLRSAVRNLVEAFLEGRRANADLYVLTHRIGRVLRQQFGCAYSRGDSGDYVNHCPIPALHRIFGHSIAWSWATRCTVCGGGELECDHIPGLEYDGVTCWFENDTLVGFDHLAFTASPDFAYTFIQPDTVSEAQIVKQFGRRLGDRETLNCDHCKTCSGFVAIDPDALDPEARAARAMAEAEI
jgi:hypothetical protein